MKLLIAGFVLTAALDAGTTCIGVSKGYRELNPIYGSNPSCTRVVLTKTAGTAAGYWTITKLPKKHRKWALVASIGINAAVVGWNVSQLHK